MLEEGGFEATEAMEEFTADHCHARVLFQEDCSAYSQEKWFQVKKISFFKVVYKNIFFPLSGSPSIKIYIIFFRIRA